MLPPSAEHCPETKSFKFQSSLTVHHTGATNQRCRCANYGPAWEASELKMSELFQQQRSWQGSMVSKHLYQS
eukprot:5863058-Amphidinium_carterae.1